MPRLRRGGASAAQRAKVARDRRRLREHEAALERQHLQGDLAVDHQQRRVLQTNEDSVLQFIQRQEEDAERHRQQRQQEDDAAHAARVAADAERHRQQRQQEDDAAAEERKARQARVRRQARRKYVGEAGFVARQPELPPPEPFSAGAMGGDGSRICRFCKALFFKDEKKECCQNGKVALPPLSPFPPELRELFENSTSNAAKAFRKNIRNYNAAFAFVSFGVSFADIPGNGPYCFKIHGQIYHHSEALYPVAGVPHKYAQVYILEGEQAMATRLQHPANQQCDPATMAIIQKVMDQHSPFVAAYRHMHQVEQNSGDVTMHILRGSDRELRRQNRNPGCYNAPTHDEVAIVFTTADGAPPMDRDIAVYPRNKRPHRVNYKSANLDPMTYPLFFPRGDSGWIMHYPHVPGRATAKRNKVTPRQYYCYRLAVRDDFSAIHLGGKLFHQFMVDSFTKMEANNIEYWRKNQDKLRGAEQNGLLDYLNKRAEKQGVAVGKVQVLPADYNGSPRALHQNFMDAMAIVGSVGPPDIFLTFTCNPKLPEIEKCLLPGQTAADRPDIVARVFKKHLDELLTDIQKRHVLGRVKALIYVIEFQKRGLPHCHLLLTLEDDSKITTPEDIDDLISAEIPDQEKDPELFKLVQETMVHGPCGPANPQSTCMKDGRCSKKFPKDFQEETAISGSGYATYRRRNNGRTVRGRGGALLDNRSIVPYSRYFILKFRAHINLEILITIGGVKYIFKYVYKGHDCANIEANLNVIDHDEIKHYLDMRYVSPHEAIWRLNSYQLHFQSHTVVRLAVHLPNRQQVYFAEGQELQAAEKSRKKQTTLTAFFALAQADEVARNLLYTEIPERYVFKEGHWRPRKQGGEITIPRIYSVSPRDTERYYMRILLLHVPGPRSYEELRTVDNVLYDTFREACIARHLLADDRVWKQTLAEAVNFQMPRQLRVLFATVCLNCTPADPLALFNEFKDALCQDYLRTLAPANAENRCLLFIQEFLQRNGSNLDQYNLPKAVPSTDDEEVVDNEGAPADNRALLNQCQSVATDAILAAAQEVENNLPSRPRAFFIDGPGGSGKTFVYNTISAVLQERNVPVATSAFTGIAATLLNGGRTLHSLFKLPIPLTENSTCNVQFQTPHADYLRSVHVFIVDEASMIHLNALRAIDVLLRDLHRSTVPFGGRVMVLGGDFRQVLPVIPRAQRVIVVENCIKSSPLWAHFQVFKLHENMRARPAERDFASWLLQIGDNSCAIEDPEYPPDSVELPQQCIVKDVRTAIFPNFNEDVASRAILTPKNDSTIILNTSILERLPGQTKEYLSVDTIQTEDDKPPNHNYPIEYVNSLTPSGVPQHRLKLKREAIVMLMRNIDIRSGLCNGTRLRVKHLGDHVISATVLNGNYAGNQVLIPRFKIVPSEVNLPFVFEREQFPLTLSYAMTINKSQGQTFEKVGLYLPQPVFSHGQLYVALSRARAKEDIAIQMTPRRNQGLIRKRHITTNVVYPEVLDESSQPVRRSALQASSAIPFKAVVKASQKQPRVLYPPAQPVSKAALHSSSAIVIPSKEAVKVLQKPVSSHSPPPTPTGSVEITSATPVSPSFMFHPVNMDWQRQVCSQLQLRCISSNGVGPGGIDIPLTAPRNIRNVGADGNCLFRSFSVIVTGTEDQHLNIRKKIKDHMLTISDLLMRLHIDPTRHSSAAEYVRNTGMDQDGTWGTDVEIFSFAHLTRTTVFLFSEQYNSWTLHAPSHVDSNLASHQATDKAMYIVHPNNHFDVLLDVM